MERPSSLFLPKDENYSEIISQSYLCFQNKQDTHTETNAFYDQHTDTFNTRLLLLRE